MKLKGKKILIVGASRGIGEAIAKSLLLENAEVIALSRGDLNYSCEHIKLDIIKNKSIHTLREHIKNKHHFIDGIVFAAAKSLPPNSIEEKDLFKLQDPNIFNEIIKTNLLSIYNCIYNLQDLLNDCSSIVMLSSIGAHLSFPNNPGYQVSKAGLESMARSISYDLGSKKIRANSLVLGYIKTDMTSKSYSDEKMREERTQRTILKRWGSVNDITGAVKFLLSEESSYITGTSITIDGGWLSKGL